MKPRSFSTSIRKTEQKLTDFSMKNSLVVVSLPHKFYLVDYKIYINIQFFVVGVSQLVSIFGAPALVSPPPFQAPERSQKITKNPKFAVRIPSLKLTAFKALENGWLEYDHLYHFLLGRLGLFSGAFWLVSGRVVLGIQEKPSKLMFLGIQKSRPENMLCFLLINLTWRFGMSWFLPFFVLLIYYQK